jgi:DNA adenine methylase
MGNPSAGIAAEPEARPILKWAGGKGRLLESLLPLLPAPKVRANIHTYMEPFIGGGSMFFRIFSQLPGLKKAHLGDANPDLIDLYQSVGADPDGVSKRLSRLVSEYRKCEESTRMDFYLSVRERFNQGVREPGRREAFDLLRAAQFLFLNRTCYNGLFRVNSSGKFNVPFGRYVNPAFPSLSILRGVAHRFESLEVQWHCGDFSNLVSQAGRGSFVYYDPPYRPVSTTASFTAYAREGFTEPDQLRLADAYAAADKRKALQMLSNSDPGDGFFEKAYSRFRPFHRVMAPRAISRDGAKRKPVPEWVILNYQP